ncbi:MULTISPECIES: response regulator [Borreliella]|uniref:Chemotaxis response regulator n=1 Tax=Borreliella burgdorferi 118a TaxID=476210 RepID=A0A7U8EYK0_BORBG|nr:MULTISPECIES: response regulator [Borreliella]EEE18327.1 chemotaxis response regulator [Borreliella burgdorferi 72a]EEF83532.1 chemotaxis response regulator [Borreliella burgdorferi CA-11.2A]EEG99280.1 chemotaxis response regulator [Borreliella burgdorferi 118a]MCD2320928.1 response regulator [Borreliella burgdorferi]MCD2322136.1 response regulator [Borreliella burgdorferi]
MKKRILVIDDNRAIRQSVAYILEQNGFGVSEAKDGLEGVLQFKEAVGQGDKDFDLVITDINMPNLDGIGVIKQIREFGSFVPILVLTTESEQSKVDEGRKAGATGWLVKPFNPEALMKTISKIF